MSKWQDAAEAVLIQFQTDNGIPYDYRTYDCPADQPQLPDSYIVYFLVDDPEDDSAYDGQTVSHQPRVQASFYFTDRTLRTTIPDKIEAAFMAANFMRIGGGDLPYNAETGHYGWRCDFRFYERR